MNNKRLGKVIWAPILLVISYLIITQLAYLYTDGLNDNVILTLIYTSINYFSIFVGYISYDVSKYRIYNEKFVNMDKCIIMCALCTIVISIYNIKAFYPDVSTILTYIFDPGSAYEYVKYMNRNQLIVRSQGILHSMIGILLTVLTFTKYYLFGFLILFWKEINKSTKYIGILSVVIYLVHTFLIGAMVNIGTLAISMIPLLIYIYYYKSIRMNKLKRAKLIFKIVTSILIAFILLLYFMGSRDVFKLKDGRDTAVLISGLLGFIFYISHGYSGLAQCLYLPFVFTGGYTTFKGIYETIGPYLGVENLFINSYLMRNQIETGRSALQVWSTIFPWLASDISFILVPFVMFIVGYLLKTTWKNGIKTNNPFALIITGQLLVLCFMIPANNQLFHTFGNSIGTIIMTVLYIKSKRFIRS